MNLSLALYLIDLLRNIDCIFGVIAFFGSALMIISFAGKLITMNSAYNRDAELCTLWSNILKKWWIIIIFLMPSVFIPKKSTMYLIAATSYLQESNLPKKVTEALELRLDEYINELKDKAVVDKDKS